MPKIRPKEAKEFLELFGYDNITVAAIAEPDARNIGFNLPHFQSTKYSSSGKPKIAHTLSLDEMDADFFRELAELQKMRRAIYFMVNESDGETTEEQPNPNRKGNVLHLNACFCDTDNCNPNRVIKWLNKCKVRPHIVVETSPKKYHFYFLLDKAPLKDIHKWKAIQKSMEYLGDIDTDYGMDKTMHDITQLMRLPGFLHQKKDPFEIKVVKVNHHDPYTIDELFFRFQAENFYTAPVDYDKYQYPEKKISAGERHEAFRNYALSVANDVAEDDLVVEKTIDAVDGFILKNFEKPRSFLQGGSRRKEVLRTVKDAITLAKQTVIDTLPPINYDELDEVDGDNFSLSDSFYYHTPGIVGEIVADICKKARYPIPAFTWASTVALLGALKSPFCTSDMGHAPANYFLCLAPTGAGKNYPQEVLSATLESLQCPDMAVSKIRSSRGLEVFLEAHNSNGLITIDESEGLLASLNDAKTPHHVKTLKELLLELYSKTNTPNFNTGWVGDKKTKPTVLHYPRLNMITYGVVHTIESAFTEKSIMDGLLQRFIVLTHMKGRKRNPNFEPAVALNGHFAHELKELINEANILTIENADEIAKVQKALDASDDPKKKKRYQERLNKLKEKSGSPQQKVIPFKVDALDLWNKYSDKLDDLADKELGKERGFPGLFTRGAEQVGRLAVALTQDDYINKDLVQYCIDLVDSRIEAIHKLAFEKIGMSDYYYQKETLFKKICKRYAKIRQPVTYRYVSRNISAGLSRRYLRDLVDGLYDDGRLKMIDPPTSGGRGKGGESFVPTDLLEQEL